jgi:hypothetical protein
MNESINQSINTIIAESENSLIRRDAITRQWLSKRQVSTATLTYATTQEVLEAVFSMWSVQRIYNSDPASRGHTKS